MDTPEAIHEPIDHLSRKQRRVLGTLIEKGLTTPDQYPLTLKAATSGCNQKNNRDPVTGYDEDTVYQSLDELRVLQLVGFVRTEGGRTERYRHYCRQRLRLSEPQLAVLAELLLRGRQQVGELRARASRMVAIDTIEMLRDVLKSLMDLKYVRANGDLDRRGVEVDHDLYAPGENHERLTPLADESQEPSAPRLAANASSPSHAAATPLPGASSTAIDHARIMALEAAQEKLTAEISTLREAVETLQESLHDLKRQLGA